MSADALTHVTVLTPPGRSAVAVLEVRGPRAVEIVDACFQAPGGRRVRSAPAGAIRFGRWLSPAGEEVVVCRREAQRVEVHCHGGAAAIRAAVASLVQRGCREEPWTNLAASAGHSRAAAAAQLALRNARTERTAAILLDQASGALDAGLLAAVQALDSAQPPATLHSMLNWADLGPHLAAGWRLVLTGAPNVGKSSLANAMVGFDRAIVFDQPGTTRDVVTTHAAIEGWPITLADTAGIRDSEDSTEAAGILLARDALANADLILDVRDASLRPEDPGVLGGGSGENRLVVWNKSDLAPGQPMAPGIATSALQGAGIDGLLKEISRRLVPATPEPGEPAPVTHDMVAQLRLALRHHRAGDNHAAKQVLLALLAPAEISR